MQFGTSKIIGIGIILLLIISLGIGIFVSRPAASTDASSTLLKSENLPAQDFQRAQPGKVLSFPKDHGAHPDYQTEWWYYTGNLRSDQGKEFGYQLTFFRRALLANSKVVPSSSDWLASQVYMAHFAVVDVSNETFSAYEQFERGAAGLAGTKAAPLFDVWLRDWRVEQVDPKTYQMTAQAENTELRLSLVDTKGIVLQGNDGYSQKGPEEGNASYYYSLTRLETTGLIRIGENDYPVKGFSWMDHEYGTSALGDNQVGWDWFAIQLEDGSELMVYTIRDNKGEIDSFSRGIFVDADGATTHLTAKDFNIQVKDFWKSSNSGGRYPSQWVISIPGLGLELNIRPKVSNQELLLSFIYWEGAVSVVGQRNNRQVNGWGYTELTGYAVSMQGRF